MPVEIDLGTAPAGYAVSSARASETVSVQFREFTSTEDGQHFIQRLEGLPNDILQKLPTPIPASKVDHMLALCHRDGTATVYVNELEFRASVRWRGSRSVDAGEAVTKDDFVDVERLELGVQVPQDAGALFVFSVGWRKGLFYDFGPVGGPSPRPREEDISVALGRCFCHVLFQERFRISDFANVEIKPSEDDEGTGGKDRLLRGMKTTVTTSTGRAVGFVLDTDADLEHRWQAVRQRLDDIDLVLPNEIPDTTAQPPSDS